MKPYFYFLECRVEVDEGLQDVEDLGLAPRQHVVVQVHVQRLRVRRQRVVPEQI